MNLFKVLSRTPIIVFSLFFFSTSSFANNLLYMNSEAGDYIGKGQEWNISDIDHTFSATKNYDNGVSVSINGSSWWSLAFTAPGDALLTPGAYENATRFPFQSPTVPGLSVSGNGSGCNTLTGRFVVHEVAYSATDLIDVFAADFEQHCEGGEPALFGSIRINSSVPVSVSQPIASAGADLFAVQDMPVNLDGSNSAPGAGATLVSYYWSQVSGPAVIVNGMDTAVASFIAPDVNLGGETLEFNLQVQDSSGQVASDNIQVTVASKSDPMTYVHMQSQPGDYIGQGNNYDFNHNTGVFSYNGTNLDTAQISYQGANYWNFNFGAIQGTGLTEGSYQNATRFLSLTTNPIMSISGAGRGCNTLTGSFDVLAISRNSQDQIESLAVDFEQHCEGFVPALLGQLRINYIDPSVPTADAGNDVTVASGEQAELSGLNSTDSDGTIMYYEWSQVGGIPVSLNGTNSAHLIFTAPAVASGITEILTFQLTVTDNLGYKAVDTVQVNVVGMDPLSYCSSKGNSTNWEWAEAVTIGGLNHVSGNNFGYSDNTTLPAVELAQGQAVNVALTPGFASGSYNENWSVWIDLNHNMDFEPFELVFSGSSNSIVSGSLTIPADALLGKTRMRVSVRYGASPTPCGNFTYGEVEDYTVNIVEGGVVPPDPVPGPVSYCSASGNNSNYEWIESVAINSQGTVSGNNQGYVDFTAAQTFTMSTSAQNSISLSPGFSGSQYNENWKIWVDYNQDGQFTNDESIFTGTSNGILTANLIFPVGTPAVTTRMRVVMQYGSIPQPCGTFTYGEVEDYTLQITP